jgi:hypothetical protein
MTDFEQMISEELRYLRTRLDDVHGVVSGLKVKMAFIGTIAGLLGSAIIGFFA